MMPSEMKDSHGTSQLWNAGRREMKAMEMPASAPSIAARGVYLRTVGSDEGAGEDDACR